MKKKGSETRRVGYGYLLEKFGLEGMPHWHSSCVSPSGTHRSIVHCGIIHDTYPIRYWPGEKLCGHLEFALKYDGVNFGFLTKIFEKIPQGEIVQYIQSKPTGKYSRRIWFFFEFLMGGRLPIKDISSGNYVDALEEKEYFTIQNGEKSPRHRIVNNLLGPKNFCPLVRRTEKLTQQDSTDLRKRCEEVVTPYSPELLRRALSYLYNKETKSSFEIEHLKPNTSRTEKFITSLGLAEKEDFCEKVRLIELQNRIVDPRFKEDGYRVKQNYVGQSVGFQNEIIHFICPKPDDLAGLMEGLIDSHTRMKIGKVTPVIHASVIAYGFVFLHPFEDGNGRIHRFLIHNILSIQGLVPPGLMFPVSAAMVKNRAFYDQSLEAFSRPLLGLIDYQLDELGQMTVEGESAPFYQYMEFTPQAEALFEFVSQTIEEELVEELGFLANYDKAKRGIQEIIDLPDRLLDLFIQLSFQNNGKLSARKRSTHFEFLTDDELGAMERAVRDGFD